MKPETPAEATLRALRAPEILAAPRTGDEPRNFLGIGADQDRNAYPAQRRPGQGLQAAALLALLLTGAACSPGTPASPGISKAQIAAVEVTLTEAERLVKRYTDLPVCPAPGTPCSTPGVRMTLIADSHAAYGAFKQFQAAPSQVTLEAAQLAIALLTRETPAGSAQD